MKKQKQGGYFLISASLALLLFSGALIAMMQMQSKQAQADRDRADGASAAQIALGVRGFIAAAQNNPAIIPGAAQTGVAWLKSPSCGGPATNPTDGYVPCSFSGGGLGGSLSTTVTRNAATNYIEARSVFVVGGADSSSKISRADRIVESALATQAGGSGVFFDAFSNVPANATSQGALTSVPVADIGRVVMVASNAPSNDVFLRTDGTNQMLANLNLGGMSIGNALDGRFSGDVRVESRLQVDQGLISKGPSDLSGGVVTPEIALTGIGRFASEGIYNAEVLTGGTSYTVPKPNCAAAGNNPGIYAAMQDTGTPNAGGYSSDAVYQASVSVQDSGGSWLVKPVMLGTKFDLTLAADNSLNFTKNVVQTNPGDMKILVMTRCR